MLDRRDSVNKPVLVIIPAYNEEKSIGPVLRALHAPEIAPATRLNGLHLHFNARALRERAGRDTVHLNKETESGKRIVRS